MYKIAVFEEEQSSFSAMLAHAIQERGLDQQAYVYTVARRHFEEKCDFDVLVWLSRMEDDEEHPLKKAHARALVVCEEESLAALFHCESEMVVTYGLGLRETLTPSSLLRDGGMATLQREIVRLDGQIIEPQDLYLDGLQGDMLEKLATAAVLLLCGDPDNGKHCL